ncbi:MAG: CRTAC1 family protein [Polyangiales bacterium]
MRFSLLLSFALLFSAACKTEDGCETGTCPTGTACVDGVCLEALCAADTCGAGSVCDPTNGQCYCGDALCAAPNTCSADAQCMPVLCADVVCAGDATCNDSDGLCYCGDATCGDGELCEAGVCAADLPDAVCPGGAWESGQAAFRERTSEWGLDGVMGVRLNVADIDGDGSPDLLVRRGGQALDDFGPEGVRRTWLLRNNGAGFEDISQESGLLAMRAPGEDTVGRPVEIAAFADVDNDGDLDAFLATNTVDAEASGGERSEIFLNQGDGTFVVGPMGDHRSPERFDVPAGASFVDFNLDGNIDLFVPQHNFSNGGGTFFLEDRLYQGDGTGAFVQVTESAGLVTEDWNAITDLNEARSHSRAWGSLARDLDGDGYTELLVPSYGRSPNHLWRGSAGGTFSNESVASGYAYDADRTWIDNQFAACFCRGNPDAEDCDMVTIVPLITCGPNWSHDQDRNAFRLGGNSGATSAGDIDNDGDLDLFTGEIKHWWAGLGSDGSELLINEGGVFTRPGNEATGLGVVHDGRTWDEGHMTNSLFDFDNDGRLDVYIGASDYDGNLGHLFHQNETGTFDELTTSEFFEHFRSHGVVVADFDRDGDLDIIVGHSRARCGGSTDCYENSQVRFFENVTPASNFVQVVVGEADGSNAMAIGAQVRATVAGGTQLQEVDGGHGHYGSQSSRVLHFGLGDACETTVEVRWPNAELTSATYTLAAGHRYLLTPEGVRLAP